MVGLKRGIIHLSSIPPDMNVTKIREVFSKYGKVERVYLQLADSKLQNKETKSKKRRSTRSFSEGWVEFERVAVAIKVAKLLNNTRVNKTKKLKHFDCKWNIEHLVAFNWTDLQQRLACEKAAKVEKKKTNISARRNKAKQDKKNEDLVTKNIGNN